MTQLVIFLQAQGGGAGWMNMVLLGGMILVFWLFMIRPQAKKAKLAKQFQENLQKGDKIVTIAGIHGVVNKMNEDGTIQLETSPGSYIKIEKSAISMEWTNNINKAATPAK
ncbi:preprotein translocase subunit YajC [Pseudobacter ginsenosidimutans]|uniref:Sec translocon accessory complex subunit YajC n=1 Tax=Pseudobacter ginsenosidimutans TaxID=661488 RepID=A0A4Q7MCK9_9BACT|nr:preprotein translocase subunit YajC [Pseudobacter ginsenosidimutans]QEC45331.1 preprotein translocase subunit YajC [Pseudobacter ginsenosidimutans]RZS65601.1 preprotein translocase subunit YajC [Pseudobacter ginsenosidimutans]